MMKVAVNGERPQLPSDCHPQIAQLITICWDANPKLRPSANAILERLKLISNTFWIEFASNNTNNNNSVVPIHFLRSSHIKWRKEKETLRKLWLCDKFVSCSQFQQGCALMKNNSCNLELCKLCLGRSRIIKYTSFLKYVQSTYTHTHRCTHMHTHQCPRYITARNCSLSLFSVRVDVFSLWFVHLCLCVILSWVELWWVVLYSTQNSWQSDRERGGMYKRTLNVTLLSLSLLVRGDQITISTWVDSFQIATVCCVCAVCRFHK
jgi:hypothetical protein